MDIEHLTKSQIVLLTLLVSFVTSIATGIVTVTLLDEAPPVVTQTINRVVEHTVERVVPGETQTATVVTKEKTVVVNEDDLITEAINKNLDKIVRIFIAAEEGMVYRGVGVIVSKDGVVAAATDRAVVSGGSTFSVRLSNGNEVEGTLVEDTSERPTALLRLSFTEEGGVIPGSVKYADINTLKLGQSVLTLYGRNRTSVAAGIIAGLDEEESEVPVEEAVEGEEQQEPKVVSVLTAVETNINASNIERGGVLLNLFGDVVGISTRESRLHGQSHFTPIQVAQSQIVALAAKEAETSEEGQ